MEGDMVGILVMGLWVGHLLEGGSRDLKYSVACLNLTSFFQRKEPWMIGWEC